MQANGDSSHVPMEREEEGKRQFVRAMIEQDSEIIAHDQSCFLLAPRPGEFQIFHEVPYFGKKREADCSLTHGLTSLNLLTASAWNQNSSLSYSLYRRRTRPMGAERD